MRLFSSAQKVKQYTYLFYKIGIIDEQQKDELFKKWKSSTAK